MRVMRCVYLPPALDEKLRVVAFRTRRTISEVIEEALAKYLEDPK